MPDTATSRPEPDASRAPVAAAGSHRTTLGLAVAVLAATAWAWWMPPSPAVLAATGLALALLIALTAGAQARARREAAALAERAGATERRLAALRAGSGEGLVFVDAGDRILDANPALLRWTGHSAAALVGRPLTDLLPADGHAGGGGEGLRQLHQADGQRRTVSVSRAAIEPGGVVHGLVVLRDVSPLQDAQRSLDAMLHRYRLAEDEASAMFGHAPLAMVTLDPGGQVLAMNPAAERLFGCIPPVEPGLKLADVHFDVADRDVLTQAMAELTRGGPNRAALRDGADGGRPTVERQIFALRRDGRRVALAATLTTLHGPDGRQRGLLLLAQDIGERLRLAEQLAHQAFHDPLTGLPNRRHLDQRLQQAVAQGRRSGQPFALLLIDLDRFKPINEAFGTGVGDAVLCESARRLKRAVRDIDVVARLGDDEFVVLLPTLARLDDAPVVADKLLAALAEPMMANGQKIELRASIGVATWPESGDEAAALLRDAGTAMAQAKLAGRQTLKRLGLGT